MKGYPRSQFEIINNTHINEIETSSTIRPVTALIMAAYTSDKGSENWELLDDLTKFTSSKGGLNFTKHGQAQLTVANALTNGAVVLGKRMVSNDATLANVTVRARVIQADGVSYVYTYTTTSTARTFNDACTNGYNNFNANAAETTVTVDEESYKSIDAPLFTVTAAGRGISQLNFRLQPEYYASKGNTYLKYSFEVIENTDVIESIVCAMNCDAVLDQVSQSIQNKVNVTSSQVKAKVFEDGFYTIINALAKTAKINETAMSIADVANSDFINGFDKRGTTTVGGVVTHKTKTAGGNTVWDNLCPDDIKTSEISLDNSIGIPLVSGSFGTMGVSPLSNEVEYKNLLLGTFGKNTASTNFDPIIYDVDAYKIDAIFDCNYPTEVKNAIVDLVDYRGDCVFLADLGMEYSTVNEIISAATNIKTSKYVSIYHNYFNIIDPYTKKEITVTMPYNLVPAFIRHVVNGVGRPFAGIANGIKFNNIISGTVNFLPVVIPGDDQKQKLVDNNINYISYYDGDPVMETMYTNDDTYTQLSYLHNVLAVQEVIKAIRTNCPKTRYTFLDGEDLQTYLDDAKAIIKQYKTNFKDIDIVYMADEKYEQNNIFYATIKVRFRSFIQEEYFKVIAID